MSAAPPPQGPRVVTFGCRLNTSESALIRERAAQAGLNDAVIVNTCAVTREAERQARQTIRRLRRDNPDAVLIVTGCGAQINAKAWADLPEVDQVLGNREKLEADPYRALARTNASATARRVVVGDVFADPPPPPAHMGDLEGRSRAFLQVQQGCDHHCTFCVIPLARGPGRSAATTQVVEQVTRLVDLGAREVVLTGVDLAAYGQDLGEEGGLGALVRHVLAAVPALPRLRLSSLDPVVVARDAVLLDLVADEPRLMPHLHLSVQAGADLILKRMRRRHSRAQVIALGQRLRALRPGLALGADLIAGFPTETDDHQRDTLALIAEAGLTHLHVFPYSPRPETPAARMPAVAGPVIKARAAELREAGRQAFAAYLTSKVGSLDHVLVETPAFGHGEAYIPVRLDSPAVPGSLVRVRLRAGDGTTLIGEAVS
ncbi:tRNA (N(6)-L-threonylcarbamoyladenosine(37)-C(2))-methylthiotransferase MtaB [Pararhodospirillum oryzae]|uniref:tRNA (N(6)-L-threonylcarbamoyladenosine(37)-C(2) )-methylthiotransferase MtaB n=1 Tax=Pararhodospirillum oryzae TaxID=478448 RepID=A0A512HBD8_9PROT|nr:tRNA (N(6)-L-threonylcarbamoyladenosine(37)-C(2))-methylthiotransferase MtaB [Pararhodospirillum oryzae]GEO82752.1 tRNA (N(6)-L-threonylcarbamoyladenosine(37)-C(2))-methylthiotransferase MtaB [Pararhodospirillum oryzae]